LIALIVGEHINEMQRIHEEYGAIFEHLARNHSRLGGTNGPNAMTPNGLVDLSPTALIHVSARSRLTFSRMQMQFVA